MKALDSLNTIYDLAASQRGLVTTAQAEKLGVGRMELSRLVKNGHLERVSRGVYRSAAAPYSREEEIWAVWLSVEPKVSASERNQLNCVVSHNSASWLLGIGELNPNPIQLTCPKRKQLRRDDVKIHVANLAKSDMTIAAGLPCTNASRTIVDLIASGEDLSLVSSVLADALDKGMVLDEPSLSALIDSLGSSRGIKKGQSLYEYLKGSYDAIY